LKGGVSKIKAFCKKEPINTGWSIRGVYLSLNRYVKESQACNL